ncbi:MAG: hypothetical protein Ct9H90mP20_1540 [Candidatus Neomarinimicrobiota bacterium]|nr:MAG: hypothetical protein Ct9H90mP20_1540 [Candidatus Neomarinimicrobiota bacterium]
MNLNLEKVYNNQSENFEIPIVPQLDFLEDFISTIK